MKSSFDIKRINGPFDDPGIYVRVLREGRALLFDLGSNEALSNGDIMKITDIFVTHMHVDHFIGFDRLMRCCLRRPEPLRVYGPQGIAGCVAGKLSGYTWNIVDDYPLVIDVIEIEDDHAQRYSFCASNRFSPERKEISPFDGLVMQDPLFKVRAAIVDHKVPCLAFSLMEDLHVNVDKAALERLGLPVGPWLRDLKYAIRQGNDRARFDIDGRTVRYDEVRHVCTVTRGQKISYVMDAAGTDENFQRIVELVRDSDILYIETFFLDSDRDLARERCHLTAADAGRIAAAAEVRRIEPMHISPRYMNEASAVAEELERAASQLSPASPPIVGRGLSH
jgi:ribonuclease Z